MRVLAVHAFYQQYGGEDRMFAADTSLVEDRGHPVHRFTFDNKLMEDWGAVRTARNLLWNPAAVRDVKQVIRDFRPDVAHVQNTFPSLSPAVIRAIDEAGIPVVMRLPNFRLLCVNGTLYRAGSPCQKCIGRSVAWPGIAHGCYRDSKVASAGVAGMTALHRFMGTWDRSVTTFLALDEDGRDKFVAGGLDRDRIEVRPNYLAPFPEKGNGSRGDVVFAGRLTQEKGVRTLLQAWEKLQRDVRLVIAGDGPLAEEVAEAARRDDRIEYLGWQEKASLEARVGEAALVVVPSEWAEPFGLVALEAIAAGTPAIVTSMGGLQRVIRDGETGVVVPPASPEALAGAVETLMSDPERLAAMRLVAREDAALRYSVEVAYHETIGVYEDAIRLRQARG